MKHPIFILFAAIAGFTQLASAAEYMTFPSYILEARDSEDQFHAMVGVQDGFPLIVLERELQPSPKRFVKVKPTTSINNVSVTVGAVEEKWNGNNVVLRAEVASSEAIDDVYAVLVFTPEGKTNLSCKYTEVGSLTGESQDLRLRFNSNNLPQSGWTLHFFQAGLEIYNSANPGLRKAAPRQAFALALSRHMAGAGSGDANPAPFYMPIPAPDPSMLPEGDGPYMVKVKMNILANGTVDNFMFPDDVSPELQIFLTKRLGEWLFLPRIKEGQRVDQTVVLPVKLR